MKKEIISWIKVILFALVFGLFINNVIVVNARVPSGSMENTIMTKDRIFGLRFSYLFQDPQREDIIIFKYPDDERVDFVKRIIGLPGETVEIRDGKVYIDNAVEPLECNYVKETPIGDFGPFHVPEDSYFMMGDNRNNSLDSRFWTNSFVKRDKIEGKVFFRYYPSFQMLE